MHLALSSFLLAACSTTVPTPTPERVLSGPTLQPSPTFQQQLAEAERPTPFIGVSDPTAAALAPGEVLPPMAVPGVVPVGERQVVEITAEDGTQLIAYLYLTETVRLPGILLLANDREAWGDFPEKLHSAGFTVLVLGLRDTARLADFRVAMLSLSSGMAAPDSLGVVGAGEGADVALLGCAGELLCDTAVLLSPSDSPALPEAMRSFNPRPIFLAASDEDTTSFAAAQALQAAATGENLFQPFTNAGHGADLLLNRPDLGDLIIQWFEQQL